MAESIDDYSQMALNLLLSSPKTIRGLEDEKVISLETYLMSSRDKTNQLYVYTLNQT